MEKSISKFRQWLILLNVCVSIFMSTLDGSIVNIALPVISSHLHVSLSAVQWVVTAYLITISLLLLVWGKLSDIYGKKYIFAFGFILFAAGSAACGFSQSFSVLVISRIVQAVGASAMMSLSQGIVTTVFPPNQRGKALGLTGTMVAIGSLVGPSLGGVLVHIASWRAIFYINIPIGIAGAILTFVILPDVFERQEDKSFDFPGAAFYGAALLLFFLGLLFMQQGSLSPLQFAGMAVLAAVSLAAFLFVEKRRRNPLIQLSIFKTREFSMGLASGCLSFIAMNSTLFFVPFYLQDVLKFSPLKAGLLISFYPLTTALFAPLSGWLSDKITYRPLTVAGMLVSTAALLVMAALKTTSGESHIVLSLIMLGAGMAIFQSPNNSSVMGSVPSRQLGIAGGINALARNVGMVSGTSFSVLIFALVTGLGMDSVSGGASGPLFMAGFRAVILFDAVCCVLAALLNITRAVIGSSGTPDRR